MGLPVFTPDQKGDCLTGPRNRSVGGVRDWVRTNSDILPAMAVGAVLRVTLAAAAFILTGTGVITQGDTASYVVPGRNLILHGAYITNGLPEIDRTPGYSIFVAISGMLFGNVLLVIMIQIALSMISLVLIHNIARRTFPNCRAGAIATWLYACEPVSILYTARLMPETLFAVLILAMIDRLLAFYSTSKLSILVAAALALAGATYVRPVSYYLVFPLAAALAVVFHRRPEIRWKAPAVLLLIVVPLLAAWQLRNKIETGYGGFSSIVEQNLYFFQSAELTAELQHTSLDAEQKKLGYPDETSYFAAHPEQRLWSEAQRLHFMHAEAVRILSQNRWLYLKSHLTGVGIVALTPCAAEFLELINAFPPDGQMPARIINEGILASVKNSAARYPHMAIIKSLFELYLLFLYIFAAKGIFLRQRTRFSIPTLVGIALYFLIISGGAQAVGRYRTPVMPELCVLAAGGVATFRKREGRSRNDLAHTPRISLV